MENDIFTIPMFRRYNMRIPLTARVRNLFTSRSKNICARASFREAWYPIPACQPAASLRVTWELTASLWKMPIPNWKQMGWYSPGWAAAPMSCRPIRSHPFPKPALIIPGRYGSKVCGPATQGSNFAQQEKCSKPPGIPIRSALPAGISDSRQFPAEEFRKTLQAVMRRDGIAALDYGEA